MALGHVVLITFKDGTPQMEMELVLGMYKTLDVACGGLDAGILFWAVGYNLDTRKGVHLVDIAIFKDAAALECFRKHPEHGKVTDILRECADWQVGDIELGNIILPTPALLGRLCGIIDECGFEFAPTSRVD